jgi:excisionase family DNA binding protein
MVDDREPTQEWMTVGEAARVLGVSDEAVRQKAKRRTLRSMKGNDGRLRVLVDASPTQDQPKTSQPKATQESTGEINALREHVQTLREQLDQQRSDHAEERKALRDEIQELKIDLTTEQEHSRDLAGKLITAERERQNDREEIGRLRQESAALRAELAQPWWHRLWRR